MSAMKLAALLIALAFIAPSQADAQVFRGGPAKPAKTAKAAPAKTAKAKPKKAAKKPAKARAKPVEAAPDEEDSITQTSSKTRSQDKVAENDVVVIIEGAE
jgi:hypothetical protein